MLVLYEHPLSPYAQKVKIALREKGVDFDPRLPAGIGSGVDPDKEFSLGNPRLEVPTLIEGEVRLFDSTILLEYIEDRWPEPALLPTDPVARARVRTIEEVMDTHYEAITWGLAEIRYFGRATGELAEGLTSAAARQIERLNEWLEGQLGSAVWLNGDNFGWADLSAVPFVNGAAGFDLAPQEDSPLSDWLARANNRESVAKTASEAAAAIAAMAGVADVVEQGLFKRQYRDHRLEWMIRSGGIEVVQQGLQKGNIRFTEF